MTTLPLTAIRRLALLALVFGVWAGPIHSQEIPHLAPEAYHGQTGESEKLIDLGSSSIVASADTVATVIADDPAGNALMIEVKADENGYPGVRIPAPDGNWDLSAWQYINLDVENRGKDRLRLGLRADNPGADDNDQLRTFTLNEFAPGETKTLSLRLSATNWALDPPMTLVGMRESPGQAAIDTSNVVKLILFSVRPEQDEAFVIRDLRAEGPMNRVDSTTFLPFIDRYGQFIHTDWPDKAKTDDDLIRQLEEEQLDLAAHPGPESFNAYGGWLDGPQLDATGSFRVTKYEGKWWLVDPDGRLFWSVGPDCLDVRFGGETGVQYREDYFAWVPDEDDPLAVHAQVNSGWAPHGFYKDKLPYRMFDFHNANLQRKYGDDWEQAFGDIAHQRLRSWGMNTIAAWGDPDIYRQQKTAYTTHVWVTGSEPIRGSTGYWGQFPDVFAPSFRQAVRSSLAEYKFEATDPWNIGYYVDNELAWGNETELSLAALASPADQPAKVAFVEDLKTFHRDIAALNAAWGTDYASWADMLDRQDRPTEVDRARPDLERFYQRLCETYFRTVKEELRALAPDKLYLGARFAWRNPIAVRASALYCDVVSYNAYLYSVRELSLPDGIDRPMMIGEFSFGAADAGGFPSANTKAIDQSHRGEFYRDYVESALENPLIVGVHWFQYIDQSTAGRPDEENFNVGMVSVTDQPHRGLIQGVRDIGYRLYETRAESAP